LWSAIGQGFIAGMIAVILLVLFHFLLVKINPLYVSKIVENEQIFKNEMLNFGMIFGGIIAVGVIISYISTFFALHKYLWIKADKLY
jgi:cell division transport system permease protein